MDNWTILALTILALATLTATLALIAGWRTHQPGDLTHWPTH